jgi:hypothetical protein
MSADLGGGVQLVIGEGVLRPLIRQIAAEVAAELHDAAGKVPDRLAYSEPEAARLLGLASHQLRDERLRGRVVGSRIVGGKIRYERQELIKYLASRRGDGQANV